MRKLPPTWEKARVDRLATVNARIGWKALTASEYQDEGYIFLSTPNIKGQSIDFGDVNYISEYRYLESPELMLREGDVLLAKDGSTLGITAIVDNLPAPATVNGSIAVIRPFAIDSRFLRYVLASDMTQALIGELKGGMGVPHLFQWDINRLPVPVPPAEDQRRIADFLDDQTTRIDRIIAARQAQVALLATEVVSQAASLFDPEPRVPIRYLVSEARVGIVVRPSDWYSESDDGVPAFRGADVRPFAVSPDGLVRISPEGDALHARSRLLQDDVVVVRTGDAGAAARVPDWAAGFNAIDLVILRECPRFGVSGLIASVSGGKGL